MKRCVVRGGYSHRAGLVAGIFSSWSKQWGKARENGWRPCWRSEHRSERPRSMGSCWAELPVHVVATAAPLARRESLWGDRRQRVLAAPHTLLLVHPPATALCSLAGRTWSSCRRTSLYGVVLRVHTLMWPFDASTHAGAPRPFPCGAAPNPAAITRRRSPSQEAVAGAGRPAGSISQLKSPQRAAFAQQAPSTCVLAPAHRHASLTPWAAPPA